MKMHHGGIPWQQVVEDVEADGIELSGTHNTRRAHFYCGHTVRLESQHGCVLVTLDMVTVSREQLAAELKWLGGERDEGVWNENRLRELDSDP